MLGQLLVKRGIVTDEQIGAALALQATSGKRLGELLVDIGALDERSLVDALADYFDMPVTHLRRDAPDPAALALVPEHLAREHLAIPVHIDADGLRVAVAQPSDDLRFLLTETTGHSVRLQLAPLSDIRWAIDRSYQAIGGVGKMVQAFEAVEGTRRRDARSDKAESVSADAPVVQVVTSILTQAIRDRASDVHIEPSQDAVYVRFRIDGALKDVLELPVAMGVGLVSRIKIMAGIDIVEKRRAQDGQFTSNVDGVDTDVRVATVATIWGESCVMRILDKKRSVLRLGELGMPADTHETFAKMVRSPFGLVLCAGPTGSGKTTTLYAALHMLNEPERVLTTIEDPVEFQFAGITQVEVNIKSGLTLGRGLRTILRADPDVLLVGEIRDEETARIAVQAALTGHLVLSTLHAHNAASSIARLKDMGVEPNLLSTSINAIVAQRLARRLCLDCRQPYDPTPEERSELEAIGEGQLYKAAGCERCADTGYRGRVALYEVMPLAGKLRSLVEGSTDQIFAAAVEQGMITLREDGLRQSLAGVTSFEEVRRVTGDRLS
jgi:type IV pilus assembly protein PilB